jgi:hypothetical protein
MLREAEAKLAAGSSSQRPPGSSASARRYVPPLESSLRYDELTGGQTSEGTGEKENARLKKLLAEKELNIDMLKEVSRENL